MPIVIDELVIRVQVDNAAPGGSASRPATPEEKRAWIAEVVEQVLEVLRQREEA